MRGQRRGGGRRRRRPYSPRVLRPAALLALALVACSSDDEPPPPAGTPARVVIMSDTHVIGPQYTTPVENSPADNESILRTVERLTIAREQINAMVPRPDAVIILGDVLHAAHHAPDAAWYDANPSAFSVAKELFAGFQMPVHLLMGNHDYEMSCDDEAYPRALSEALFRRFFGAEPYYAVEYGGVRFHLLNGQQGRTWDVMSPRCNTDWASFGPAQLAWLSGSLDDGIPSVLMSHYMGLLWDRDENVGVPGQEDIVSVIAAHPNVAMVLGGHTHRWLDLSDLFGYPHYVVGPARYDGDNFWVFDLDGAGGITIADFDKAYWDSTCAATYDYDPAPAPTGAAETGTCVAGIE
jgi:predicted phosphodiesterase